MMIFLKCFFFFGEVLWGKIVSVRRVSKFVDKEGEVKVRGRSGIRFLWMDIVFLFVFVILVL